MKQVVSLIYSFFLFPLIFIAAHLIGIFNKKIRAAVFERYAVIKKAEHWSQAVSAESNKIIIYAASMGEFEHIKPLIIKLSKSYNIKIIVTFFSPSGYNNVKSFPGVDLILYAPFDTKYHWRKFYSIIKPDFLVISKHDAWANQVWTAKKLGIPVFVVNASLSIHSTRLMPAVRFFLKYVYQSFEKIYSVSNDDKKRFENNYPDCKIENIGDTKFDQVLIRKEEALQKKYIGEEWLKDSIIIVFGSIWHEDAEHIFPAVKKMISKNLDVKFILVPHQPEESFINEITGCFGADKCKLFTELNSLESEQIILVNTIGVLADLYKYADIAYVGGSFKQGIHNVMEPAVYGIPVLYGPEYNNSYDAIKLLENGGGKVVGNEEEINKLIKKLINDKQFCGKTGNQAKAFAIKNLGATDKLIARWKDYL